MTDQVCVLVLATHRIASHRLKLRAKIIMKKKKINNFHGKVARSQTVYLSTHCPPIIVNTLAQSRGNHIVKKVDENF